jgi:hypothetical protein
MIAASIIVAVLSSALVKTRRVDNKTFPRLYNLIQQPSFPQRGHRRLRSRLNSLTFESIVDQPYQARVIGVGNAEVMRVTPNGYSNVSQYRGPLQQCTLALLSHPAV